MEFVLKHLLLVNMGGRSSDLLVVKKANQLNSSYYSAPKLFSDYVSSHEEKVLPHYLYIFTLLTL